MKSGHSSERSVYDALRRCAEILTVAGVESPRLESELLVAHALGVPRYKLLVLRDAPLSSEAVRRVASWLRRRTRREPIAYLLGEREFFSLKFAVDSNVLVPRPETEHLVEAALEFSRARAVAPRILDVGTGSGAIAISLAANLPGARIVAIDKSAAALGVAVANARRHAVSDRIEFVRADLRDLATMFRADSFDLLVSNPPYVAVDQVRDELAHEPHLALVSDCGPFPAVYRRIGAAGSVIGAGGAMMVEVGIGQADVVASIVAETAMFESVRTIDDLSGIPRVVIAKRAGDPPKCRGSVLGSDQLSRE